MCRKLSLVEIEDGKITEGDFAGETYSTVLVDKMIVDTDTENIILNIEIIN